MNRTLRAIIGVVFVGVIVFSAIVICQDVGDGIRFDITDRKLYTLSEGTKAILAELNQPIRMKLYYTKTAAMKAPDQIRYFNNYYYFVRALLEEYSSQAKGMVDLQIIDPRPFSDEEADAMRYGLKRFPITEEETFFFGLVVQTQFGVNKTIPFFSPDRQNFVEYDISYLIDTAIRRQKKRVGVLSSLAVMGDDMSDYMVQMMAMQGQQPKNPWGVIEQIRQQYEVSTVQTDVNDINDVDILLVIHPKSLPEKTLFAIDQFVLRGGPTIVCIDPHCISDQPPPQMRMTQPQSSASNLDALMKNWGLEMLQNTFAGDRALAIPASMSRDQRPQRIIGFLGLSAQGNCFSRESVITADLNQIRVLFAGALRQTDIADDTEIEHLPLLSTTGEGNTWSISSPYELMMPNPADWMKNFVDGSEPVHLGYLVTGRFKSGFPDGIDVRDESDPNSQPKKNRGLTEAETDCAVVVFSDVDFITDNFAYQRSIFGLIAIGDNGALLMNTLDDLSGSSNLISIRSRGNFRRPFVVVDEIEAQAEAETAQEEAKINAQIAGFQDELNSILASARESGEEVIGSSIIKKKREVELNIHRANTQLRKVKMEKRKKIEMLGARLRNFCTLPGPILTLLMAVVLGLYRTLKRKYYVSHADRG